MTVLKWFCFVMIFLDFVGYIIEKAENIKGVGGLLGFITGMLGRAFALYGTVTCWVLA